MINSGFKFFSMMCRHQKNSLKITLNLFISFMKKSHEEGPDKASVNGFDFIDGIRDNNFGGLSRTTIDYDGCTPSFLNGNIKYSSWNYAIGMYYQEICYGGWDHSKLPAINMGSYSKVSLWLRVINKINFNILCYQNTCQNSKIFIHPSLLFICLI